MPEEKYLSEVLDVSQFKRNAVNLIVAPCGSGKTRAVFEKVVPLATGKHRVLYLIDSISGKEQILQRPDARIYGEDWLVSNDKNMIIFDYSEFELDKVVIMTYAKFGALVKRYPNFYKMLEIIVCDEAHKLPEMAVWDRGGCTSTALNEIKQLCRYNHGQLVCVLTATPRKIENALKCTLHRIEFESTVKCYHQIETEYYRNIEEVIKELPHCQQSICYITHIKQMIRMEECAQALGYTTCSLWSINNTDHEMTDRQHYIRQELIEKQSIPQDIEILFINQSYETSINICNKIHTVIVHSKDSDIQIQARGRVRSDIQKLCVFDRSKAALLIPEEYLNTPLFTDDTKELSNKLGFRDIEGRTVK